MANEAFSDAVKLESGPFLDYLAGQLEASNAIATGHNRGLMRSQDDSPEGTSPDGLIAYQPGEHHPQDLDIVATITNKKPLADSKVNFQQPRRMHALIEYGDRYRSATGTHSLSNLARMTLGLAAIAAETSRVDMQTVVVGNESGPLTIDETDFDATWTMRQYDAYVARTDQRVPTGTATPLTAGLSELAEYGPQDDTDVCVIVSDFLTGARRNHDGELIEFSWEQPLQNLHSSLGDRLYVVQLATPAQQALPYARTYSAGGTLVKADMGDYLKLRAEYQGAGKEKADRIGRALGHLRHLELNSVDSTPLITAGDFIFGKPDEL